MNRPLSTEERAAAKALGLVPDEREPYAAWMRDPAHGNARVSDDVVRLRIALARGRAA